MKIKKREEEKEGREKKERGEKMNGKAGKRGGKERRKRKRSPSIWAQKVQDRQQVPSYFRNFWLGFITWRWNLGDFRENRVYAVAWFSSPGLPFPCLQKEERGCPYIRGDCWLKDQGCLSLQRPVGAGWVGCSWGTGLITPPKSRDPPLLPSPHPQVPALLLLRDKYIPKFPNVTISVITVLQCPNNACKKMWNTMKVKNSQITVTCLILI